MYHNVMLIICLDDEALDINNSVISTTVNVILISKHEFCVEIACNQT